MPLYSVTCWPSSPVIVTVEAEDEDDAVVKADDKISEQYLTLIGASWEAVKIDE
jgi:hypothetical protein